MVRLVLVLPLIDWKTGASLFSQSQSFENCSTKDGKSYPADKYYQNLLSYSLDTTIHPLNNRGLGPVSRKSRDFSDAFRAWHSYLFIFKAKASRSTKLCTYFNFYSLYNIWKDQPYRMSRWQFYETSLGLSRNGPLHGPKVIPVILRLPITQLPPKGG